MSNHGKQDGFTLLAASQRRQLGLCADLEYLADSIPYHLNRARCVELGQAIVGIMLEAQALEEQILLSAVKGPISWHADLGGSIDRLRVEHIADLCFSEEIGEALLMLGQGGQRVDAEVLGYMLRGFFEGLRRHLAFEREILFPLIKSSGSK